jgi:Ser-tRNA(Ala) deacylase AlaX
MTKRLFWQDPYLKRIDTKIHRVDGSRIVLDQTILYAESGGQESDTGSIAGIRVREARDRGSEIVYTVDAAHDLKAGDRVTVRLDWERRYRLMRLHFAAEVVLVLFGRTLPGIEKIGAHIGEEKARLDFLREESIAPLLPEIRRQAEELISSDLPIISAFSDKTSGRRFWEIEGFARVPCAGTHLKRSGEVGRIHLKRKNIGRGKERVEILLADPGAAQDCTAAPLA